MAIASGSTAYTNSSGERRQPWRLPLPRLKDLDTVLLVVIDATELLYNTLIQLEKYLPKPKQASTLWR